MSIRVGAERHWPGLAGKFDANFLSRNGLVVRKRLSEQEKKGSGKIFLALARRILTGQEAHNLENIWLYIRTLDNISDSSPDPKEAKATLETELKALNGLGVGKRINITPSLVERDAFLEGYSALSPVQQHGIVPRLSEVVQGLIIDTDIIISHLPINEDNLKNRSSLVTLSAFEALSYFLFSNPLNGKGNGRVEELFHNWVQYDALRDLEEDLVSGLILFSSGTLNKYSVSFRQGETIPYHTRNLFSGLKTEVSHNLVKQAGSIFETTTPFPWSIFLWVYFMSRGAKLIKEEYPVRNDARFAERLSKV